MPRKPAPTPPKQPPKAGTQVAFRADDELLAFIDREAKRLEAERPGIPVARSEVVRYLLHRAMQATDAS